MREARGVVSHGINVSLYAIEALSKTQREFNIVRLYAINALLRKMQRESIIIR